MYKGRCLCGRTQWKATAEPRTVHHCHCSMCRKWTGAAFATLVWFRQRDVMWDEPPVAFRSSPIARRSHCATCGTPVALSYDSRDDIALTAGMLEDPDRVSPAHHYGCEERLSWTAGLGAELPSRPTRESW